MIEVFRDNGSSCFIEDDELEIYLEQGFTVEDPVSPDGRRSRKNRSRERALVRIANTRKVYDVVDESDVGSLESPPWVVSPVQPARIKKGQVEVYRHLTVEESTAQVEQSEKIRAERGGQ